MSDPALTSRSFGQKVSSFLAIDHWRIEALALGLSLCCLAFFNGRLWHALIDSQSQRPSFEQFAFLTITGFGLTAFQAGFLSLLLWGRLAKAGAFFLLVIAASAHYFTEHYGVVYDASMLRNVLATNRLEAGELLTLEALRSIVLGTLIPATLLLLYRVPRLPWRQALATKAVAQALAIGVASVCLGAQFKDIASLVRNHREIRHLVLPSAPLVSFIRIASEGTAQAGTRPEALDPQAQRSPVLGLGSLLTVVVIGETVRAQNWGLSAYARDTTPRLALLPKDELFNFPYATACGTNTEVSVPCMFSGIGRSDYDVKRIRRYESILPLLYRAGVDVAWIDNQSGCKGVCDGVPSFRPQAVAGEGKTVETLDEVLLDALKERIAPPARDQLIVLHMLGNHGPAYFKRYAKRFARYTPECQDPNLVRCSPEAIVNAYDNAIVATDSLLADLIAHLSTISDRAVGLVYVSDHGESLGEKGIYLHGLPYSVAPQEQIRVPLFFWLPLTTQKLLGLSPACLRDRAQAPTEHDLLAHSLIGAYRVKTSVYRPPWDFLAPCVP